MSDLKCPGVTNGR